MPTCHAKPKLRSWQSQSNGEQHTIAEEKIAIATEAPKRNCTLAGLPLLCLSFRVFLAGQYPFRVKWHVYFYFLAAFLTSALFFVTWVWPKKNPWQGSNLRYGLCGKGQERKERKTKSPNRQNATWCAEIALKHVSCGSDLLFGLSPNTNYVKQCVRYVPMSRISVSCL